MSAAKAREHQSRCAIRSTETEAAPQPVCGYVRRCVASSAHLYGRLRAASGRQERCSCSTRGGRGGYRRRLEGRGAGVHWNSGGLALTDLYYHHQTRSLHLSPPVRASLLHQRRINAARHVPFRGYMTVQRQELTGSCHAHTGVSEPKWDHEAPPGSFRQPPPPP